jgi:transcriptional regulator GlxA family with amidase domain
MAGPLCVFNTAAQINKLIEYKCITASAQGGLVRHSCGTSVDTQPISSIRLAPADTVLVIGGQMEAIVRATNEKSLVSFLKTAASRVNRYGSICSGSFLLGDAGLLEDKTATTHWAAQNKQEELYKNSSINRDTLYVQDGCLWTSAGVTTGIDMALAMIEDDLGSNLKTKVAKLLVVYSHRPGKQSQFSDVLMAQSRVDKQFSGLVHWILQRLNQPIRVDEMAEYVHMSPRSFARKFKLSGGTPPGKFVERLRLDRARELIEAGEPIKSVASIIGFASLTAFRSSFKSVYGVTPYHHLKLSVDENKQTH